MVRVGREGNKTAELLNGPVLSTMLKFAAPIFLANLFQTAFNIIDMIIVGNWVGPSGLSGVSIGTDIMHFMLFFGMGLCMAGQVIISRHLGAGDQKQASLFIGTLLLFVALISIALMVVIMVGCHWALALLNTPPEAYDDAYAYTMICMAGLPFSYLYNAYGSIMRSHGDTRNPLYFVILASVVHIAFAFILMVYLDMGVAGAALSTVIGQGSSLLAAFLYVRKHREAYSVDVSKESMRIDGRCLKALLKLGIPMALQFAAINISRIFVSSYINSYGVVVSAATGVVSRVSSISFLYSSALSSAVAVITSHALGAQNTKRVRSAVTTGMSVSMVITALVLAFILTMPETVFGFFTSDQPVLAVCMEYLIPFTILDIMFAGFRSSFLGMINGSGRPVLNYSIAILDGLVGRIGIAILCGLVLGMGYQGFWWGNTLGGAAPTLVGIAFIISNIMKRRRRMKKEGSAA